MNHTELFRTYLAPLRQQKSGGNLRHARRGSSPARLEHPVFGKAEAIRETVKNFAKAESIEIHILALYESTDTVAGELHIGVDGKIDLYLEPISKMVDFGPISCWERADGSQRRTMGSS